MIRLTFTGDLLAYKSLIKKSKCKKGYDFSEVFSEVKDVLSGSDYVVGNLETPLGGPKHGYTQMDMLFNTPDEFALAAKNAGFDMFTTANNHCLDAGFDGLKRTLSVLDNYGIDHTGTFSSPDDKRYFVKQFGKLKVAFVSYTYGTNPNVNGYEINDDNAYTVNLTKRSGLAYKRSFLKQLVVESIYRLPLSLQNKIHPLYPKHSYLDNVEDVEIKKTENKAKVNELKTLIHDAKIEADMVVFCLHSGGQFNSEIGLYTQYLINEIKSCGVNAIIVNHPHCVLNCSWEEDGTFIATSLGNFTFTPEEGYFVDGVYGEYGILLNLDVDEDVKSITDLSFSIVKNIRTENGREKVILLSDLFKSTNSKDREKLVMDNKSVIERFLNHSVNSIEIKDVYSIKEFK